MSKKETIDAINKVIIDYREANGKRKPAFIYLGVDEMEVLLDNIVFKMQNRALTPSKAWTYYDIEVVEVQRKSFLEVGEKNENR